MLRHGAQALMAATEALFQLKFTAKSLNRQAKKAAKDETAEKNKLKAVRRRLLSGICRG